MDENEFVGAFEQALIAEGVRIDRREVADNELMGAATYLYLLTEGDRHCYYPLHSFYMLEENSGLAPELARHAVSKLRSHLESGA